MQKYLKVLSAINFKTLYFNLKYLPFKHAIKFPFLISNKVRLRNVTGKVEIEGNITFGLIKIGFSNVGIFDGKYSRSIWEVSGNVIFKGKAAIGQGSKISVGPNGILILGENFTITAESSLVAFDKIQFGNNCLLSWDILVMDTDFHKIIDENGTIINLPQPIYIEDNVWVGCRSLILKGSVIPKGSIIGANSTVTNKLENDHSLYLGSPSKCYKKNITWRL